jgi:hypothetical protein
VIVHADHEERRARRGPGDHRQPPETGGSEHRFIDDDRVRCEPGEEANQVRQVGGRSDRLDARLVLEEAPERCPDPLVPRGDDDRDGRSIERTRLD